MIKHLLFRCARVAKLLIFLQTTLVSVLKLTFRPQKSYFQPYSNSIQYSNSVLMTVSAEIRFVKMDNCEVKKLCRLCKAINRKFMPCIADIIFVFIALYVSLRIFYAPLCIICK